MCLEKKINKHKKHVWASLGLKKKKDNEEEGLSDNCEHNPILSFTWDISCW